MFVIIAHLQILHLRICLFLTVHETWGAAGCRGRMSPEIRKLEIEATSNSKYWTLCLGRDFDSKTLSIWKPLYCLKNENYPWIPFADHYPDNKEITCSWALQKDRIPLWGETCSHLPSWPQALSRLCTLMGWEAGHAWNGDSRGCSWLAGQEMHVRSYAQNSYLGIVSFSNSFSLEVQ